MSLIVSELPSEQLSQVFELEGASVSDGVSGYTEVVLSGTGILDFSSQGIFPDLVLNRLSLLMSLLLSKLEEVRCR